MFRGLRERAAESFDAAFSSPPDAAHVGRVIAARGTRYRLGRAFAEGGFSFVHKADPLPGPARPVAVKRLSAQDDDALTRVRAEARLLDTLPPHPNIVRYYGSAFHPPEAYLVFELLDGGSLPEYLDRRRGKPLTAQHALDIFADIVAAVVHLHAQTPPITCRDLKLENVLYCPEQKRFKLCDFGSCTSVAKRYIDRGDQLRADEEIKEHSSAPYRAPELCDLFAKPFLCERVDVWSLGCVFYGILFGDLPFDGQSTVPILKGRFAVPQSHSYPESFVKLLSAMLTVSPAKRADSFTVMEAVCRLRGVPMDDALREAGARLREQRRNDFRDDAEAAGPKSGPGLSSGSLVSLSREGRSNSASRDVRSASSLNTRPAAKDMDLLGDVTSAKTRPSSIRGTWADSTALAAPSNPTGHGVISGSIAKIMGSTARAGSTLIAAPAGSSSYASSARPSGGVTQADPASDDDNFGWADFDSAPAVNPEPRDLGRTREALGNSRTVRVQDALGQGQSQALGNALPMDSVSNGSQVRPAMTQAVQARPSVKFSETFCTEEPLSAEHSSEPSDRQPAADALQKKAPGQALRPELKASKGGLDTELEAMFADLLPPGFGKR